MMASTKELDECLRECEISPTLPLVKLFDSNLPLSMNPFFYKEGINAEEEPQWQHKRTPNCRRCRQRRRSESVLDDYNKVTSTMTGGDHAKLCNSPSTPRLQRTSLKKSSPTSSGVGGGGGTGQRKLLVREPVLRALQTCLHAQSCTPRRRLQATSVDDGGEAALAVTPAAAAASTTSTGLAVSHQQQTSAEPSNPAGMSDFRDLIHECRALLEQDVAFSGRLNHRNFTTLRSANAGALRSGVKAKRKPRSLIADAAALSPFAGSPPATTDALVVSAAASARASNSTCSQQAGNGCPATTSTTADSASDDVTIDELASYFDTFVHIPKKMSTMAEMMYI